MHYATIDIGSNTVLLLIASIGKEGEIIPLLEKAEITRLGQSQSQSPADASFRALHPEAMERTLKVLRQYTDLCHRNQVEGIACVGTEALRRAYNSNTLVRQIEESCGFKVEIIPGKKEAELAYLSAMLDFREVYPNLVVVDIGGGSTELIWETETTESRAKLQMISMKMGSVRLTERFIRTDPVSSEEFDYLSDLIETKLNEDLSILPLPKHPLTLIGLAGTVTTLSSIAQKLKTYDSKKVQGSTLTLSQLEKTIEELKKKNLEEKKQIVGIEPKRADVLLAGAMILEAVMKKFKAKQVVVSDHGIRYGLFYQRFMTRPR